MLHASLRARFGALLLVSMLGAGLLAAPAGAKPPAPGAPGDVHV